MADFEKIKRGLRAHLNGGATACHDREKPCPYLPVVGCTNTLIRDTLYAIEDLQSEVERMKRDGKTCANCSRCKTRMARGTGCYYQRCKKHNMWVRSGFYCSDWQKEGDGDAD